jgi:hypothetical protein
MLKCVCSSGNVFEVAAFHMYDEIFSRASEKYFVEGEEPPTDEDEIIVFLSTLEGSAESISWEDFDDNPAQVTLLKPELVAKGWSIPAGPDDSLELLDFIEAHKPEWMTDRRPPPYGFEQGNWFGDNTTWRNSASKTGKTMIKFEQTYYEWAFDYYIKTRSFAIFYRLKPKYKSSIIPSLTALALLGTLGLMGGLAAPRPRKNT